MKIEINSREKSAIRIHMIGIGGAGMKSLASHFASLGCCVTGSDLALTATQACDLRNKGILVYAGHHSVFVTQGINFVVYSPAIPEQNPERLRASELGIVQFSYPEMLAKLTCLKQLITIAGTHGKSSTTAMTGWIFDQAQRESMLIFGGDLQKNQRITPSLQSEYAIIEACEFQKNFLHYYPRTSVILNIEHDHFESYPVFEDSVETFARFAMQTAPNGYLLTQAELNEFNLRLADYQGIHETFSLKTQADWQVRRCVSQSMGYQFNVQYKNEILGEVKLNIPGYHQVGNALAAFALGYRHGIPIENICKALGTFPGVQRRFEYRGTWRGVTLIDDYAHHPSAVAATLETARELYPAKKIWAVFQPHQAKRLERLMHDFCDSFEFADEIIITPVFAARENQSECAGRLVRELTERLQLKSHSARVTTSLDQVLLILEEGCQSGDVVLFLGAGDCDRISDELVRKISRNYAC